MNAYPQALGTPQCKIHFEQPMRSAETHDFCTILRLMTIAKHLFLLAKPLHVQHVAAGDDILLNSNKYEYRVHSGIRPQETPHVVKA